MQRHSRASVFGPAVGEALEAFVFGRCQAADGGCDDSGVLTSAASVTAVRPYCGGYVAFIPPTIACVGAGCCRWACNLHPVWIGFPFINRRTIAVSGVHLMDVAPPIIAAFAAHPCRWRGKNRNQVSRFRVAVRSFRIPFLEASGNFRDERPAVVEVGCSEAAALRAASNRSGNVLPRFSARRRIPRHARGER